MPYDALEELEETAQNTVGTGLAYDFTSLADADEFSQLYNHENHYKGLKIGQSITITKEGLQYSRRQYVIVGFDLEANNLATDGTSANNGYGVYLITPTWATQGSWSDSATVPESYINSSVRYWISRDVYADEYRAVIGDHLVKRNVLLSSSVDSSSGRPNGYTWTQEYITCPTMCNMTGDSNIDDGELNFQLSLCKSSEGIHRLAQDLNYYYWSRNIYGIDTDSYFKAWQYQVRYDYKKDYYYFNPYKRKAESHDLGTASIVVLQMIMIR